MKRIILALMIVGFAGAAFADAGHNHEAALEAAPHGGTLRDAPPYKVELVLVGDTAKIYVYDKALKPVVPGQAAAKGHLRFPKEKQEKEVIFKLKKDFYEAALVGISKTHRYDLHVNLEIDGKKIVADFGVDNIH